MCGYGFTIEAGVLEVPSIKIAGFHRKHASVDLAEELGIKVAEIDQISTSMENLKVPNGEQLLKNGKNAVTNILI